MIKENNREAGLQFVEEYRRLADFCKGYGVDIIDIDIAPKETGIQLPPIRNKIEARTSLRGVCSLFDLSQPDGQFLVGEALATMSYLEDIWGGSKKPWSDRVWETMHIEPQIIDEKKIDKAAQLVSENSRDIGYKFNAEGWRLFFEKHQLTPYGAKEGFKATEARVVPSILDALGQEFSPDYRTEYVLEEQPWTAWINKDNRAEDSRPLLRINTHPTNSLSWSKGSEEVLAIHEIGAHVLQMLSWEKRINDGEINPGYGILTIPGLKQYNLEGLAITLPEFLPDVYNLMSDFGRFSLRLQELRHQVFNNVQIELNKYPVDVPHKVYKSQLDYVRQFLPNETEERFARYVKLSRKNSLYKLYYTAYQAGTYDHLELAEALSEQQQLAFVKEVYGKPMSAEQIGYWVKREAPAVNQQPNPRFAWAADTIHDIHETISRFFSSKTALG